LSMKMTNAVDKLAKLYVDKMVRLHGVPVSIVFIRTLDSLHDYSQIFNVL
jgi:hypothetical protein